jgi:cardiolipin synthase A/B
VRSSKKLSRLVQPGSQRPWTGEKLYFQGDDYFRDVLAAIGKARKSVNIETYIFETGRLGDQMAVALIAAKKRGVTVRLLVDGVGSPEFLDHYGPRLKKAGIDFRVYRSWPTFFSSIFHRFRWMRPLWSLHYAFAIWNTGKHRDHRKQYIVDGRKVWIGSFNVSDWHLQKVKGKAVWRDTGIGLSGVRRLVFLLAFRAAWEDPWPYHSGRKHRHFLIQWLTRDVQGSPIRMTASRKLRRLYRKELLGRMTTATRRIWVLTPYFVPTGPLLRALARAARRGCDVRLILPGHSDVPMVRWASMAFYPALLKAGCRIFEYQGRVLHAKTLMVDSWTLVGSANLDYRSLRKDLEVNVIPFEKKSIRELEIQMEKDIAHCREVSLDEVRQRPLWTRFLSAVFFHFRYWF